MIQWRIADTKEYHIKENNIERNILYWRVIANVRNTLYNRTSWYSRIYEFVKRSCMILVENTFAENLTVTV